jgi:hypothetical protein
VLLRDLNQGDMRRVQIAHSGHKANTLTGATRRLQRIAQRLNMMKYLHAAPINERQKAH